MLTLLAAAAAGLVCGVLSGFGIGGGSLLMVWMTAVLSMEQRAAQGVNLLYFLPCAACALIFHIKNKQIVWRAVWPAALAGSVCAVGGALLAQNVEKLYYAIVEGELPLGPGVIDAPIARLPLPSLLRQVSPEGKPSVTEFEVLHRDGQICKLALCPVTGRTHQLRVHCAYMGFPILGDPQYGTEESRRFSSELGLTYQMLCAHRLEFTHPLTGDSMVLESRMDVGV